MTTVAAPVIRNDEDLSLAINRIESLWGAEPGTERGDELDVAITLVRDYELRNHRIEPPTAVDAVLGLMDRLGLSRAELIPLFGSASRVSEFLNGKRGLSKAQIKSLHESYGVPYESLMA